MNAPVPWTHVGILAIVVMVVVAMLARQYLQFYNGDWHFSRTFQRGDFMRRWINGKWERRELTEAEDKELNDRAAW